MTLLKFFFLPLFSYIILLFIPFSLFLLKIIFSAFNDLCNDYMTIQRRYRTHNSSGGVRPCCSREFRSLPPPAALRLLFCRRNGLFPSQVGSSSLRAHRTMLLTTVSPVCAFAASRPALQSYKSTCGIPGTRGNQIWASCANHAPWGRWRGRQEITPMEVPSTTASLLMEVRSQRGCIPGIAPTLLPWLWRWGLCLIQPAWSP